ncbi:hypothetical protein [Raineya sp.]|jgi:hypothetical protein
MILPEKLLDITDFLKKQKITLSEKSDDGRINASFNEKELLNLIQSKFEVQIPKARAWYDFALETQNTFIPVNIKVSQTTQADNLNCKLGIYYALTGILPDFSNEIPYENYFTKLKVNLQTYIDKDYYFLVVNKNDNQDIFVNSLKCLQEIQPNGNNLPFQCKWDSNRNMVQRNFQEAKDFILKGYAQSLRLRAEAYFTFEQLFPEYFEK